MDAVDEVKQRLNVEDVVGEYVELKRAGRNFKALSPFSNEKTASLMVSPEKQIWHDFSSGKGGDIFTFVMEMEGQDFKGALDLLARKAGVDLSQFRGGGGQGNAKLKQRLHEANELAAKFYQVHLSKSGEAVDYVFKKRTINKETALSFQLGYAPNNGAALTDFLLKKGFTADELKKAGLSTQRAGRPGDMFRGRIMIPLMDPGGQVIGFTGRLLNDEPNAPKYLNTPQTILYDKSRHVFGLHLAKQAIRQAKFAVVVEGNMDVVASHQVHVNNVVATAGTAMTEYHLKALERFVPDVRLAFDQDKAGIAAAERIIPLAGKTGVDLSIITVKDAKDPDELIQKDPGAWEQTITQPEYALDWLMRVYAERLDLASAQGKRQYSDVMLATVRALDDAVEQEHYLEKLGKTLGVSREALKNKLKANPASPARKKRAEPPKVDPHVAEIIKAQNQLLALAFMVPNLRGYLQPLTTDMLPEEPARELFTFLREHPDFAAPGKGSGKGRGKQSKPPKQLKNVAEYATILGVIFEELYQSLEAVELRYEAARLQTRLIEHYVKTQKAELTSALHEADDAQTKTLLTKAKALDALLNVTKQGDA